MGIAPDGSSLFVHHLTDLRSNQRLTNPYLVTAVGLQRATTVVRLAPADCLGPIPSGDEDDYDSEFVVPSASKLSTAGTAAGFAGCKPSSKNPSSLQSLCLLPLPPFLVPCVAANAHSSFPELGAAIAAELAGSAVMDKGGKRVATTAHAARLLHFLCWANQPVEVT